MFPGEHFDDFLLPFSQPRTTTMSFMFKSKGKFLDNVPCDPGRGMNRLLIVGLLLFLTGCGNGDTPTTPTTPIPPVGGAWEITAKSAEFTKRDSATIDFPVTVPAKGEATLTYSTRYTW